MAALQQAEVEVLTLALSADEILDTIEAEWERNRRLPLLDGLCERDLTEPQKARVVALIVSLIAHSESLPSGQRVTADRAVYRLLFRVDGLAASRLALEFLGHRRTFIRKAAYRFLKTHGVPPAKAAVLIEHHRRTGSQEPLQVLARSPLAVAAVNPRDLLALLDERYWRMRVLESLLLAGTRMTAAWRPNTHRSTCGRRAVSRVSRASRC